MKNAVLASALALGLMAGPASAGYGADQMKSEEVHTMTIKGVQTEVHVMRMANGKVLYGFGRSDLDRLLDLRSKQFSDSFPR